MGKPHINFIRPLPGTYRGFVSRVVEDASKRLNGKSVCVDGVDEYWPCKNWERFNAAVKHAVMETKYWDGDGCLKV